MALEETTVNSWRTKVMLIGAVAGAAVGLGTAYLLARTAEEESNGPPRISTADALKASVSIIGVVRGIASLAKQKK
jgi:gas vesicle protein